MEGAVLMELIGQVKSSFIDYPDRICTVYFVRGCNYRCPYCHNSHLLAGRGEVIQETEVFGFLEKRKKLLDAVCISGGEPTLQQNLLDFALKVKQKGYLVKLDTNGTRPGVVKRLIDNGAIDYIAMDIKAPIDKYDAVVRVKADTDSIRETIELIAASNADYEFRTTVCNELLSVDDIVQIAEMIKGSKRYIVQNFRDGQTVLTGRGHLTPFDNGKLQQIQQKIVGYFDFFKIR
jgi:pyruvate formate lyase activating enzyme